MKFVLGFLVGFVLGWIVSMIALQSQYMKPSPTVEAATIELQTVAIRRYQEEVRNYSIEQHVERIPVLAGCAIMRLAAPGGLQCSRDGQNWHKVAEVRQ